MQTKADAGERERVKDIDGLNNGIESEMDDFEGHQVIEARIGFLRNCLGLFLLEPFVCLWEME
jgi:hypothetical protein